MRSVRVGSNVVSNPVPNTKPATVLLSISCDQVQGLLLPVTPITALWVIPLITAEHPSPWIDRFSPITSISLNPEAVTVEVVPNLLSVPYIFLPSHTVAPQLLISTWRPLPNCIPVMVCGVSLVVQTWSGALATLKGMALTVTSQLSRPVVKPEPNLNFVTVFSRPYEGCRQALWL